MAASPPQTQGYSGSCLQFVLNTVSADLVKFSVQRRDSLGTRVVFPKLGRCQGRFEMQGVNLQLNQLLHFVPDARGRVCHHKNSPYEIGREFPVASQSRSPRQLRELSRR